MTTRGLLSVPALAEDRGWSRWKAWRYLRRLERHHALRIHRDERGHIFVSPLELQRVVAGLRKSVDPILARELAELRDRVDLLEAWKIGILNEFRRLHDAVRR